MATQTDEEKNDLRVILNKLIEGKVDANRRYVDQVLEKIQEQNHRYFLEKLVIEVHQMELEEKAGNLVGAFRHKVMVDTYKGILEKSFGITDLS
ncbi:MAG: hypothetical protein E6K88_08260 [Thaumarchaeota archaeon]|nr:MAG: hypothetical protein E6K88_08260 [Nitrososphaerota archaeon]